MSVARSIARSVQQLYALYDDPTMTPEKARKLELARLSAKRLRGFLAQIEAGKVHGQGPDAEVSEDAALADVFTVRELTEEAERRGWAAPRLPPLRINSKG